MIETWFKNSQNQNFKLYKSRDALLLGYAPLLGIIRYLLNEISVWRAKFSLISFSAYLSMLSPSLRTLDFISSAALVRNPSSFIKPPFCANKAWTPSFQLDDIALWTLSENKQTTSKFKSNIPVVLHRWYTGKDKGPRIIDWWPNISLSAFCKWMFICNSLLNYLD